MSETHSPGPWTWRYFGETLHMPQVANANGDDVITFMPRSQKGVEMSEADARLIAAAPELLEALTELIAQIGEKSDGMCCRGAHRETSTDYPQPHEVDCAWQTAIELVKRVKGER